MHFEFGGFCHLCFDYFGFIIFKGFNIGHSLPLQELKSKSVGIFAIFTLHEEIVIFEFSVFFNSVQLIDENFVQLFLQNITLASLISDLLIFLGYF